MAKFTIKQILTSNKNWWRFFENNEARIRLAILICVIKLLSCKNTVRGYHEYRCSNPACSHVKHVPHTCKCKACSSCGKKATEIWIKKQTQLLPNTSWQHITFTMPSQLWDFFWYNRWLLNKMGLIAANCVKSIGKKKKVIPGIFIAIHTFGRDLKRNVHVHLSVTTGGITEDLTQWKNIFFHQETLMRTWRYQIIQLFRKVQSQLVIPPGIQKQLHHAFTFNQFLDLLYKKHWIVHCSKPSTDHKQNIHYLGRYVKRPAIAESKLKHYDGHEVTFKYLDHNTKTYRKFTLTVDQFIARFIQHIPDAGFRMIRYYGFLAHRVKGKLLPIVYQLLGQETPLPPAAPTYAELIQINFNFNPLVCLLCGQQMLLTAVRFGITKVCGLLLQHRALALLQKI